MITETINGFNIEGNELNIDCITSKSNNFQLDSEGNLTVNSITIREENTSGNVTVDSIYPVGSIYMNTALVDPSTIFGGTWKRIAKGRTIVGVDENDTDFNTVNKTGGSKYMQEHYHPLALIHPGGTEDLPYGLNYTYNGNANIGAFFKSDSYITGPHKSSERLLLGNSGNLQPYITCYIWTRIA